MPENEARIDVASYNVHRFVGTDGVRNLERVAAVIRQLDVDILALQEVESGPVVEDETTAVERLVSLADWTPVPGPTLRDDRGDYGNLLLVRTPVVAVRHHVLPGHGHEPRGVIDIDVDLEGRVVRVLATHLGLRGKERLVQARFLFETIDARSGATVVIGDFNEWNPASRVLRAFRSRFGRSPAPRTFPSRWPLLPLDRIWVRPPGEVVYAVTENAPLVRHASDHLPVRARVRLPGDDIR